MAKTARVLSIGLIFLPIAVSGHYCSNFSNGVVAPRRGHNSTSICNFPEGEPIRVNIDPDGQPKTVFHFGGKGQAGKRYVFATCGFGNQVDTGLSIWNSTGDLIGCDDDSCILHRESSSLVFTLPDEETYVLRPWKYDGNQGTFDLGYVSGGGCNALQETADLCVDDPDPSNCRLFCDTLKCHLKPPSENQTKCDKVRWQYKSNTSKLPPCSCASLKVTLRTDASPDETSLVLESITNKTRIWSFTKGSLTPAFHQHTFVEKCLDPSACYQLTIDDLWADGICCLSGLGSFEITYSNTLIASGGDFEQQATYIFGNCP